MNASPLPIGVVVPTLNVRPSLPAHLEQMKTWIDLVQEVVVVDSYSSDGTFEFLQAELRHPGLKLFQCPPGLYQAWNNGISHVGARYTYISTIGDTITREGLDHLAATAEALGCDVVVSRPDFFSTEGTPLLDRRWPVHKLIDSARITKPVRLAPWHAFLVAILDLPEGILGSSASNIYRSDTLKRFPFPVSYGHAGDTAWGIQHAFHTSIAVTPRVFSRFVVHPNENVPAGEAMWRLVDRLLDLAAETVRENLKGERSGAVSAELAGLVKDIPAKLKTLHECQRRYDVARVESRPWFMSAAAWKARAARNRKRAEVRNVRARVRNQINASALV
jgi:hypothetical protein